MQTMETKLGSILDVMVDICDAVTAIQLAISIKKSANEEISSQSKQKPFDVVVEDDNPRTKVDKGKKIINGQDNKYKTPVISRRISINTDAFKGLLDDTDIMELSSDDDGMQIDGSFGKGHKQSFQLNNQAATMSGSKGWDRLDNINLNSQHKPPIVKVIFMNAL